MRKLISILLFFLLPIFCFGQKDSVAKWIVGEWRYMISLEFNQNATERTVRMEDPPSKITKKEKRKLNREYKRWGYYYYIFRSDGSMLQGNVGSKKYPDWSWEISGRWSLSDNGNGVTISDVKTIKKEKNESAYYHYCVKGYKFEIRYPNPFYFDICEGFICNEKNPNGTLNYIKVK